MDAGELPLFNHIIPPPIAMSYWKLGTLSGGVGGAYGGGLRGRWHIHTSKEGARLIYMHIFTCAHTHTHAKNS